MSYCFCIRLIVSYSFFQIRHSNVIIGGLFGLAMMISFGIWMISELFEAIAEEEELQKVLSILAMES